MYFEMNFKVTILLQINRVGRIIVLSPTPTTVDAGDPRSSRPRRVAAGARTAREQLVRARRVGAPRRSTQGVAGDVQVITKCDAVRVGKWD